MTDEELTTTVARSQDEVEKDEEGKEPRSTKEQMYYLIHMAGGWFPILLSTLLIIGTFAFMWHAPEQAGVCLGFLGGCVLPILIGHQAWKTRQAIDSNSAEINRVSAATTRTAANKVISNMAGTVAEKVTNKIEDKVVEMLNKSAIVIQPPIRDRVEPEKPEVK